MSQQTIQALEATRDIAEQVSDLADISGKMCEQVISLAKRLQTSCELIMENLTTLSKSLGVEGKAEPSIQDRLQADIDDAAKTSRKHSTIIDYLMSGSGLTRRDAEAVYGRAEPAIPKYFDGGWNTREIAERVLRQLNAFRTGEKAKCIDATNGAHFLEVGKTFTVDQTQLDSNAGLLVFLQGMAKGWPAKQFEKI